MISSDEGGLLGVLEVDRSKGELKDDPLRALSPFGVLKGPWETGGEFYVLL